jgi:hypothetical protein
MAPCSTGKAPSSLLTACSISRICRHMRMSCLSVCLRALAHSKMRTFHVYACMPLCRLHHELDINTPTAPRPCHQLGINMPHDTFQRPCIEMELHSMRKRQTKKNEGTLLPTRESTASAHTHIRRHIQARRRGTNSFPEL